MVIIVSTMRQRECGKSNNNRQDKSDNDSIDKYWNNQTIIILINNKNNRNRSYDNNDNKINEMAIAIRMLRMALIMITLLMKF